MNLFEFYLASMFVLSMWRRVEQYRTVLMLAWAVKNKYPNLLRLVREHRTVLLSWPTLRPAVLALALCLLHTLATRLIWPQAHLSSDTLFTYWAALAVVLPAGLAMVAMDTYFLFTVAVIDRPMIEKHLAQAEFWLKGWKASAVKVVTAGKIDPRQMVHDEVRKALMAGSDLLSRSMWWTSSQVGLRILFGLSLWLTWAVTAGASTPPESLP